jgi:hypothetical protein
MRIWRRGASDLAMLHSHPRSLASGAVMVWFEAWCLGFWRSDGTRTRGLLRDRQAF